MKIIIIGSPGSGKSTLTRMLIEKFEIPVLHLDKIYHTGVGKEHITREELVEKVNLFASENDKWIIDGNYISTIEMRINLADTIILFDLSPEICIQNAKKREIEALENGKNTDDMADGFDPIMSEEFISFVNKFSEETMPKINDILSKYNEKNIFRISDYSQIDEIIEKIKKL